MLIDFTANLLGYIGVALHERIQISLLFGININFRSCRPLSRLVLLLFIWFGGSSFPSLQGFVFSAQTFCLLLCCLAAHVHFIEAGVWHAVTEGAVISSGLGGSGSSFICGVAVISRTRSHCIQGFRVKVITRQKVTTVFGCAWLVLVVIQNQGVTG